MKHLLSILCLFVLSCDSDTAEIEGCTDADACNYDETATVDDDSCIYAEENYDCDDNCIAEIDECGVCNGDGFDCGGSCSNENIELWGECYNIEGTTYLNLYDNQLTGEIPSEIGNLTNLTYLSLSNNQLSGVIPEEICNQGDSTPNVEYNNLCPPYPECISQNDINSQDTPNCP